MGKDAKINPGSSEFTGVSDVLDARNRPLQEGDEIILDVPGQLYFRIAQIVPNLDPRAAPGQMIAHVGCMVAFVTTRGQINREFIRVRTVQEAGESNFKLLDAQPQGIVR